MPIFDFTLLAEDKAQTTASSSQPGLTFAETNTFDVASKPDQGLAIQTTRVVPSTSMAKRLTKNDPM